jgi:hypothetical protein
VVGIGGVSSFQIEVISFTKELIRTLFATHPTEHRRSGAACERRGDRIGTKTLRHCSVPAIFVVFDNEIQLTVAGLREVALRAR